MLRGAAQTLSTSRWLQSVCRQFLCGTQPHARAAVEAHAILTNKGKVARTLKSFGHGNLQFWKSPFAVAASRAPRLCHTGYLVAQTIERPPLPRMAQRKYAEFNRKLQVADPILSSQTDDLPRSHAVANVGRAMHLLAAHRSSPPLRACRGPRGCRNTSCCSIATSYELGK